VGVDGTDGGGETVPYERLKGAVNERANEDVTVKLTSLKDIV